VLGPGAGRDAEQEVRIRYPLWLYLAVLATVLVGLLLYSFWWSAVWLFWRLLPPQRHRAVPWSGREVLLATLFLSPILTALFLEMMQWGGIFPLWGIVCAFPFQLAIVLVVFEKLSGTSPYQLGLSGRGALRNVVLGLFGWLIITPLVYFTFILAQAFYSRALGFRAEEHPLTRFVTSELGVGSWLALGATTVVVAPVVEELLFRGILQPWLARRRWGGAVALGVALALALADRLALDRGLPDYHQLLPALFVVAMVPSYLLVGAIWRTPHARSIFATALLFAAAHSSAWPQPVGLFPLGLALGFLAYRTQNLVAPIVCHALFNSVALAMLLLSAYLRP
jgi:membrane protease YdiL (CAAX protease family)